MHSTSKFLLCVCLLQFAHMVCTLLHTWTIWLTEKMAVIRKCLKFSLQSASNDIEWYWTKRKQQSNLAHHQWYTLWNREYEWLLQLYGCALQFQDTLQRTGWSTAIGCKLLLRAYIQGMGCCVWARTHFKRASLKHSNRVHIALACWHSGHRVSFMRPWC